MMGTDRPIPCTLCLKEWKSNEDLEAHISSYHLKYVPYRCGHCKWACPTEHYVNIHMDETHPGMEVKMFYYPIAAEQAELMKLLLYSERNRNKNRLQISQRDGKSQPATWKPSRLLAICAPPTNQNEGGIGAPHPPPLVSSPDVEFLKVVKAQVSCQVSFEPRMVTRSQTRAKRETKEKANEIVTRDGGMAKVVMRGPGSSGDPVGIQILEGRKAPFTRTRIRVRDEIALLDGNDRSVKGAPKTGELGGRKRKKSPEKERAGGSKSGGNGEAERQRQKRNPPALDDKEGNVEQSSLERARKAPAGEGEKKFVACKECEWNSSKLQLSERISHVFTQHIGERVIWCPYCRFSNTGSIKLVRSHIGALHPDKDKSGFLQKRLDHIEEVNKWMKSCFPGTEAVTETDLTSQD